MKKSAIVLMAIMLCAALSVVALVGCGGSSSSSAAASGSTSSASASGSASSAAASSGSTPSAASSAAASSATSSATTSSAAASSSSSSSSNALLTIDGVDVKDISFDMVGDTPNFMIIFSNTTDKDVDVDLSKFQAKVDDADEVNFHLTSKTIKANTPYAQNAFTASAGTMKAGDKVYLYYDGTPVGTYEVTEF